jgi:hypothetical protein
MNHCRVVLHHVDGRVEESTLDGDGPIMMGSYVKLPPHADHWWKVVALRWGVEGRGYAEMEPTTLPPHLRKLETT